MDINPYKVSISRVIPSAFRHSLHDFNKCMLCISLRSKNAEGLHLEACAKWVSERFASCLVVPVDTVYRYTLQITEDLEEADSIGKAAAISQDFVNEQWPFFEPYGNACRFELRPCSVVEKSPFFAGHHRHLTELYARDASFQTSVNAFASEYLTRLFPGDPNKLEAKWRLAVDYFLEEAANFACIVDEGWRVFLYAGSIKPFEDIAMGKHPDVPAALKNLIWTGLRLKKRKSAAK